jgi:hypothetical protein
MNKLLKEFISGEVFIDGGLGVSNEDVVAVRQLLSNVNVGVHYFECLDGDYPYTVVQVNTNKVNRYGSKRKLIEKGMIGVSLSSLLKGGNVMNKNNKSEGIFTGQMIEKMGIEKVIFNDDATIVFLKDGRKGVAVQSASDDADRLIGLSVAYAIAVGTDGNKSQFRKNIIQLEKHDGYEIKKKEEDAE